MHLSQNPGYICQSSNEAMRVVSVQTERSSVVGYSLACYCFGALEGEKQGNFCC